MTTRFELHFRATAGAYGETSPAAYVLPTDTYPTTRNGITFGWDGSVTSADVATPGSARLSGRHSTTSNTRTFRLDLPEGAGKNRFWLGLGIGAAVTAGFQLFDSNNTTQLATQSAVALTNAQVGDATGAVSAFATWLATNSGAGGGSYVEVTTSGSSVFFRRSVANGFYISHIAWELQAEPLDPCSLSKENGTGSSTSIYCKEPLGKPVGRVTSPKGVQAFSVQGAAATYYTVANNPDDGNLPWLFTAGTRLPAGAITSITIRQTTVSETKDTVLSPTIVDPGARPVDDSKLGRITSESYVQYAKMMAVKVEEWPGYAGQSFTLDVAVSSGTALIAAITAITPSGSNWYRIRLQDGDYSSTYTLPAKDFGAGGLLIEPDTGHDPIITGSFKGVFVRKVHWRNTHCAPNNTAGNPYTFYHDNEAGTPYPLLRITGWLLDAMSKPGETLGNILNWGNFISMMFCEQIVVRNCIVQGCKNFMLVSGGRLMISENNHFTMQVKDFHALSTAYAFTTPRGVFADNETYAFIQRCTIRKNPDVYTGLSQGATPHGDGFQYRRGEGYAFDATPNGSGSAVWTVGGTKVYYNPEQKIYTVTAVADNGSFLAGHADPATPPTGTGATVSGGVTFTYSASVPGIATNMNVLMMDNVWLVDGQTYNTEVPPASPNIQFAVNSNPGFGNTLVITAINNFCASGNIRGIDVNESVVNAEYNTFVAGADMPVVSGATAGLNIATIAGTKCRAFRNIVGYNSGPYIQTYGGDLFKSGNVAADFKASATAGRRPGDVMRGAFSQNAAGDWGFPTMQDDGLNTPADFVSKMSKQLHHSTGAAGARLREVHTITVSDSAGHSATRDLVVAP